MKLIVMLDAMRQILMASWETVNMLDLEDDTESFKQNWLQANWEMILETFLSRKEGRLVLLDYYGEGSEDLHYSLLEGQEGFDRVSLPSMAPTHTITCRPIKEKQICSFSKQIIPFPERGLVFGEFVSVSGDQIVVAPPFDHVILISDPFNHVAPFHELEYLLTPIDMSLKK